MAALPESDSASGLQCIQCKIRRDLSDLVQCSDKQCLSGTRYYCRQHCYEDECGHDRNCAISDHISCWDSHLPARRAENHRQTDPWKNYIVDLILHSEKDKRIQDKKHERDRKAQWFYVNVGGYGDGIASLQISERFTDLCAPGSQKDNWKRNQYPSLVCFVGDTGVGKSTLVNAMMLMGRLMAEKDPDPTSLRREAREGGPVTRSGHWQSITEPTSSGVHLYKDPSITQVQVGTESEYIPLLFADCEGFAAGTVRTNAERSTQPTDDGPGLDANSTQNRACTGLDRGAQQYPATPNANIRGSGPVPLRTRASSMSSFSSILEDVKRQIVYPTQSRYVSNVIPISAPQFRGRKEATEQLYAQFLYAFSDVVVFVSKEDQQMHRVLIRMLEWAATAVNKSVNSRPYKSLIIVRNMATSHDDALYDDMKLKEALLQHTEYVWEHSELLQNFKLEEDRKRESLGQRPMTQGNEAFIKLLFQDIKVCYIPLREKAPSDKIYRQYQWLRRRIESSVREAQQERAGSYTRYDVPTFTHLTNRAFHHFACYPEPFDFFKAARKDNPTPGTMAEHIANFLRHIVSSSSSLDSFATVVAACLVCWVDREFRQAVDPSRIFEEHLQTSCKEAVSLYQSKYQHCAFRFPPKNDPCITPKEVHDFEHTASNGKVVKLPGQFDPSDFPEPDQWTRRVQQLFLASYLEVNQGSSRQSTPAELAAFRLRKLRSIPASFWASARSNKTCFTCLQTAPDHVHPCAHGYCETCVTEFGEVYADIPYAYRMRECILCAYVHVHPQIFPTKPKCAGVRVLALDGGGVRGIVELAILSRIEKRVGLGVQVRDLFDLIIGTSTGGIVSLGLAMTDLSTTDIKSKFLELGKTIFERTRMGDFPIWDPFDLFSPFMMAVGLWESKYKTRPLKRALQELLGHSKSMFTSVTETQHQRKVRVAVTSSCNGQMCIFSNYTRMKHGDAPDFEREDDLDQEMRVWEAALATSAAPSYFKAFKKEAPSCSKTYFDGALHANMPARYALEEAERIWPPRLEGKTKVDILVSVGTGIQNRPRNMPLLGDATGFKEIVLVFLNSMDTEAKWQEFTKHGTYDPTRHHRLNATVPGEKPVYLDQWSEMQNLDEAVRQQSLREPLASKIEEVAHHLTASLLFFEPIEIRPANFLTNKTGGHMNILIGEICCRLRRGSKELGALALRITGFYWKAVAPEDHDQSSWASCNVRDGWKAEVRREGKHLRIPVSIPLRPSVEHVSIAVTLESVQESGMERLVGLEERKFGISGFPMKYRELWSKCHA